MWLISFRWFKENCAHLNKDYDFNKDGCDIGDNEPEVFTIHPETKDKHYYQRCKEKDCPVLRDCKQQ